MLGDSGERVTPDDPVATPSAEPIASRPAGDAPVAKTKASRPIKKTRPAPRPAADGVRVAGFWQRFVAAWVDLAVIVPVGLVLTWIASRLGNVHLPPSRIRGPDFWLDLVLHSDPWLMTGVAMFLVVITVYMMVFQLLLGQTLGMRLLRMRVIDVWGERPSIARCAARTAGYLVGIATAMLGFLWVGFDSEKRGLHDWIAGTYVIKA
jgi:uncharacterized RDD family membrane protein YckC